MDFEYKDGKCIVLKKEMENCLVLPKGTFSPIRDVVLSKEGFDKLKEYSSKDNVKSGECCVNRQHYDECYVIPMGILHPKAPMLLSHAAISGIGAAIAKAPSKAAETEPTPAPVEPPPLVQEEPKEEETKEETDDDQLTLEIAEENLAEAKEELANASGGDIAKAQEKFTEAQKAVDDAKARIEKRVKPDDS